MAAILLESVLFEHIGPFKRVHVDFTELPPGVIAITGAVGSGKSTLVEAMAGCLYGKLPTRTRGRLADLATSKEWDAQVFASLNGQPVSCLRRHGIADYRLHPGGQWDECHLPNYDVWLSSAFSAQGTPRIVDATDGERKALLLRALGLEELEAKAKAARERSAKQADARGLALIRLEDEQERGGDVELLEQELAQARNAEESATYSLEFASQRLQKAQDAHRHYAVELAASRDAFAAFNKLSDAVQDATDAVEELEDAKRDCEKTLAETGPAERLQEQVATFAEQIKSLEKLQEQVDSSAAMRIGLLRGAIYDHLDGRSDLAELRGAIDHDDEWDIAEKQQREQLRILPEYRAAIERAKAELAEAQAAQKQLAQLNGSLPAARERLQCLEQKLVNTPAVSSPPQLPPELLPIQEKRDDAERKLRDAAAKVAVLEQRLSHAQQCQQRVVELQLEADQAAQEAADWAKLGQDLGRDGVQALEIDAAGPELTALTNDLLHQCWTSKYTVSIETTRPSASGKRELEALPIRVTNADSGVTLDVRVMSGGERALIGEALQLALLLRCQKGSPHELTLVRDEPTAAWGQEDCEAYVAMLRRASRLVRARQVLVVTHSPLIGELADCVLHVENLHGISTINRTK